MGSHQDEQSLRELRDALQGVQDILALPQLVTLLTIAIEPGLSVNALGDRLGVPQQTASRHVAMLTGRYANDRAENEFIPLISQEINQRDPRKRALFLTEAGLDLLTMITTCIFDGGSHVRR